MIIKDKHNLSQNRIGPTIVIEKITELDTIGYDILNSKVPKTTKKKFVEKTFIHFLI